MARYRTLFSNLRLFLQRKFTGYSEICFLAGYILVGILVGTAAVKPTIVLSGMISMLAACLLRRFISNDRTCFSPGPVTCNPLLVGLSIGYLLGITTMTVILIACAGMFTLLLTGGFDRISHHGLRLPILTLPFAIVSAIACMLP